MERNVEESFDHGAMTIGSPLQTSLTLYTDLQETYKNEKLAQF